MTVSRPQRFRHFFKFFFSSFFLFLSFFYFPSRLSSLSFLESDEKKVEKLDKLLKEGKLSPIPQDHSQATYAPMLKKEDGKIDWEKPAKEIRNLIRGALPWPSAYTNLEGKLLKIYKARIIEGEGNPGEVMKSDSGILRVATGKDTLDILELQIEGGKKLKTKEFLRGRKIKEGTILGS